MPSFFHQPFQHTSVAVEQCQIQGLLTVFVAVDLPTLLYHLHNCPGALVQQVMAPRSRQVIDSTIGTAIAAILTLCGKRTRQYFQVLAPLCRGLAQQPSPQPIKRIISRLHLRSDHKMLPDLLDRYVR